MKKLIIALAVFAPAIAMAQYQVTNFSQLVSSLTGIGNTIITVLVAFAVLYIIFNAVMFIVKADSEDRAKYRSAVLWGIVALAIMLSIWGLVALLRRTFVLDNSAPNQDIPQFNYVPQR